jgi:hypothetical protein
VISGRCPVPTDHGPARDLSPIVFEHPTMRAGGVVTSAAGHIVIYDHDGITGFR